MARAWVGQLGLEGDGHRAVTVHGGPLRAVSLLGLEAIERVQADGHPIQPGSVGENLTTEGVELAALPTGSRLAVGEQLVLEITWPAMPCDTIAASFRDGQSGRISVLTHPLDSRVYARVIAEGEVRPGDPFVVLAPAPDSDAERHRRLQRLEAAERAGTIAFWDAARAAGFDVRYVDDGELLMGAAPELPGPSFNLALGLRTLPHLLPGVLSFFSREGVRGWVTAEAPPWPGGEPDQRSMLLAVTPGSVPEVEAPSGVTIRRIDADETGRWVMALLEAASPIEGAAASAVPESAWRAIMERLAFDSARHRFIAEIDGEPVGVAALAVRRRIGLLATAAVVPAARGRGIHRALIAARARLAEQLACFEVIAAATPASTSARNFAALGFTAVSERGRYPVDP